jgi:hypothetical protein
LQVPEDRLRVSGLPGEQVGGPDRIPGRAPKRTKYIRPMFSLAASSSASRTYSWWDR